MAWQRQTRNTISAFVIMLLTLGMGVSFAQSKNIPDKARVMHVINRLSFGPAPGDVARVEAMGIDRYIQLQLSPESIPEVPGLAEAVNNLQTLHLNAMTLRQIYEIPKPPPGEKQDPEVAKAARERAKIIVAEASQARLMRAIYSNRQLQEVMLDFWFNHFNVYSEKGQDRLWVGAYEEQAIRPYVLGRFRDLLGATAHHPAMLVYLDNAQNRIVNNKPKPGALPTDTPEGVNENYAREIMELHTLGVDGGYTQQDVIALARVLTGWGFCDEKHANADQFGFCFNAGRHDKTDKVFLGNTIKAGGEAEGEQALDILAKSPATAHHICYQLAQYFVADTPPKALVDRLSQRYLQTDGNIKEVLNMLFHSQTFWDKANIANKYKTPYHYLVSSVRASGLPFTNYKLVLNNLNQMGMPLYGCLTPDGYKNTKIDWLNPDALLRRLNFVSALTTAHVPLRTPGPDDAKLKIANPGGRVDPEVLASTLGNMFSSDTQTRIDEAPEGIRAALMLSSPEFMYF